MSNGNRIIHIGGLVITLSVLWLSLSGHYTLLLLSLGGLSVLSVAVIGLRMKLIDYREPEALMQFIKSIPYGWWLIREILRANLDVCLRIVHPGLPISPRLVWVEASQRHDLSRVVYANSITLTPGTISIDVEDNKIEVHVLTAAGGDSLQQGEMDRRISRLESRHV